MVILKGNMTMHDIIIIGAGPAGLTAAVYALRAGKTVLILEKESVGGQIASSPKVENWPGTASISGAELADGMFDQAMSLGADFELENVVDIIIEADKKVVVTEDGQHECHCVIAANGAKHRHLGLDREDELAGVSYCAVCDGAFYKGKTVAVIGGGSTALQDAIFLSASCKKVYVVHRRDQFRGESSLVDTLSSRGNVEFLLGYTPEALLGTDEITGVTLKSVASGTRMDLAIDGLFVAIGHAPENQSFAKLARLDEGGYFAVNEDCAGDVPGFFVAGDCRSKTTRQLTTAVADGTVSALAACKYIDNL